MCAVGVLEYRAAAAAAVRPGDAVLEVQEREREGTGER